MSTTSIDSRLRKLEPIPPTPMTRSEMSDAIAKLLAGATGDDGVEPTFTALAVNASIGPFWDRARAVARIMLIAERRKAQAQRRPT